MNQPAGFDCPGCAWPEPAAAIRHRLEFCENGAKALAEEATTARATPETLFARLTVDELRALSDFELGQLGRLTHPMVARSRRATTAPISWDAAFALVADELRAAGPAATAFYTSGRTLERGRVPVPARRPHVRHEQLPRLLEHVPRVERRRARRDRRRRQGHGLARRLRARRPDPRHRPEPGHEPPAHADDAARGGAARRDDRRDQPAARGRARRGSRTRSSRSTCSPAAWRSRSELHPGPDRRRPGAVPRRRQGACSSDARAARSTARSSTTLHRRLRRRTPRTSRAHARGRTLDARRRRRRGDDPPRSPRLYASARRRDRVLGDGPHAAQARGADDPGDRQRACSCAATSAAPAPACARCADTPTCRAIARWASTTCRSRRSSTRSAARSGSTPPRAPGLDAVDTIHAIERGDVRAVFVALGGNFVSACPDTDRTARALETLRADRRASRPSSTARTSIRARAR